MKRAGAWILAVSGLLVLALLALSGMLELVVKTTPMPQGLPPESATPRYRMAVLGDSQKGLANLANLVRALRAEQVIGYVHTGDLVSNNDEGHYRLAALALSRGGIYSGFVAVPGNHDVTGGTERFRRHLGDLERTFRCGSVTYVLVDNALGEPPDVARLEARVAAAPAGHAIVMAMHVPPFDVKGAILPAYQPFVAWLEKSRVRYLFCGQIHDYVRKRIGQTVVIANGVGGDYESWQLKQKVYATILEVDGTTLTDRTIELQPEHGFVENLEHFAIGHVAEAYRRLPWACWPATALMATLLGWSLRAARRHGGPQWLRVTCHNSPGGSP